MIDLEDTADRYARIVGNLFRSKWSEHGEQHPEAPELDGRPVVYITDEDLGEQTPLPGAALITSRVVDGHGNKTDAHKLLLDLDVDAVLIPSSHPGHHHLLIDKLISKAQHDEILRALARAGIVEEGYAEASANREHGACLRTPWTVKPDVKPERRTFAEVFRAFINNLTPSDTSTESPF